MHHQGALLSMKRHGVRHLPNASVNRLVDEINALTHVMSVLNAIDAPHDHEF